jgi:ABC-type sugar transport system substrate-binding protein
MLLAVILCCFTACASGKVPPSTTEQNDAQKLVIAYSANSQDVFQAEWSGIFKELCAEAGVELITTNAEAKVDKQLADVEALIEKKPDIILIRAADSIGVVPAFEACAAAGIPTLAADILPDGFDDTLKIGSNQYDIGLIQNAWYVNKLETDPDYTLKIGYIWGSQGMNLLFDRYQGFVDGLVDKYPGRVEVLAEKVCNWSATEAMAVTEDWLQAYPEMNAILSQSDEMALGCINVLTSASADFDNFAVCAYDGSPEARQAIREGKMKASVFMDKRSSARVVLDYAIRIANGENLVGEYIDYTNDVNFSIDSENISEIMTRAGIED